MFSIMPTVLMPLSALSYASVIGIVSTVFLVLVMFVDGLSKKESPGSLWSPAPTSFNPGNMGQLGLAFGLFMAGVRTKFAGIEPQFLTSSIVFRTRSHSFTCPGHGRPFPIRHHDQLGLYCSHLHIYDDWRDRISYVR